MSGMNGGEQAQETECGPVRFDRYCPGPRVSPFVRNYWAVALTGASAACHRQRVVPDGCLDMIFVRRSLTEAFRAFIVGAMTRPIFEELTGRAEYLGVRFAPGGFGHFFRTPAGELTDRIVSLENLSASSVLVEQVADAPDVRTRLAVIENDLQRRLISGAPDPTLAKVLDAIFTARGLVGVSWLARRVDWSPRHLRRVFGDSVGVGPKMFCRIVRFRQALRTLRRRPPADLLGVALDCGYYDQAHFIHEFRSFYGATPSTVGRSRGL
jgi:AraC-like DNA-binding protein